MLLKQETWGKVKRTLSSDQTGHRRHMETEEKRRKEGLTIKFHYKIY